MNFKNIPETQWEWGYPLAWGVMLLAGLIMLLYFWRKRWT
jgi:magnesium transporter